MSGILPKTIVALAFVAAPLLGANLPGESAGAETQPVVGDATAAVSAYVGAALFASPEDPSIENAAVLIEDARIRAAGPAAQVKVPAEAAVVDARGLSILPGFWNAHVHFAETKWANAAVGYTRDYDTAKE